jgi:hypothetical protein
MFITRKALPRRMFLRGMGAAVALPMLDAMAPALSAATAAPPRLGFIYIANGVIQKNWNPATTGTGFELSRTLQPLAKVRDSITVLSGLAHEQADTFGDGTGDHPRASAAWLTGVHAYDRTQPGAEVRLATTADQLAANHIGKSTRISSLELTVDFPTQGACDSGDCFYVNTVSWRNPTTPNPAETNPRVVFERLFGDGGDAAAMQQRARDTGSILDSVLHEVGRISSDLGPGDRTKLDEYLDSVREIEKRVKNPASQSAQTIELVDRPVDVPESFDEYTKLMLDLQALAFRADLTRVFSLIMSRELSSRTFAFIGVPDQHHAVSHHRDDPDLIEKKTKIDVYQTQLLAYFLEKLHTAQDGDGTLLDHSLILYGSGMGDGNLHRHFDLPCLLAGGLNGTVRTGRHINYPDKTPMTNLLVSLLDKIGLPVEKLGDSTGRLTPDPLNLT